MIGTLETLSDPQNILILIGYDSEGHQTGVILCEAEKFSAEDIRSVFTIWRTTVKVTSQIVTGISEPLATYDVFLSPEICTWKDGCSQEVFAKGLCLQHFMERRQEFRLLR